PLDAINAAAAREKSIRHGHPSTLHLWWARRPLAAARAVIFSQLVHDPEDLWRCENPGVEPNKQIKGHWTKARARLFSIIEDLVKWENTTNERVLEKAREEIRRSWRETCELNKDHPQAAELFNPDKMPGLHDPFAGGGAIPLEAQRLGLEAFASDLNPVAVLINKAMIEIPPKFANRSPVRPEPQAHRSGKLGLEETWKGATGLAEDVRYYGQWMRDEAFKRIGHLYPPNEVTKAMVKERPDLKPYEGEKLTVIAWLWARTVHSPNPAFSYVEVPLASTFILSSKEGKNAYVQPVVGDSGYAFTVKVGTPPSAAKGGTTAGKRKAFRCLMSDAPIHYEYIRDQGKTAGLGQKLMAIVAEGTRGRIYLSPTEEHESLAGTATPEWKPDVKISHWPGRTNVVEYGLTAFSDLFTPRQLLALTTFSDLVDEARERIRRDAVAAKLFDDDTPLDAGGTGARAYAEAVSVYLGLVVGRAADYWTGNATWEPGGGFVAHAFTKQAIPMTWDFAESSPFSDASGNWEGTALDWVPRAINIFTTSAAGYSSQRDAQSQTVTSSNFVSTDPPYYDNISYADLSDYFYVWLRRSLREVFPNLLATIAVPKAEELVARAKGTSVDGVKNSGVLHSAGGNVRLLKWAEYSSDWDPKSVDRLPIWEVLHQLIRVFNTDGESGAAAVFATVQSKA
ncbi:MAG: DUF1156 domain-containing protein, partial [Planctomycetota bacterium]